MDFNQIGSETVYQGRAFDVRRDRLRTPTGQEVDLDIVEHVGAVTVIPLDDLGRIWFVRQYRHAAGTVLLELPAGTLEPGEEPLACAQREIREETGQAAKNFEKVGEFFLAPGYSTEYMHVYLATDLHPDPLPGDDDEFLSVVSYPVEQVFKMVLSGDLVDAKSLAALTLVAGRVQSTN
jgi:ADP-ribose pyrophosphatase